MLKLSTIEELEITDEFGEIFNHYKFVRRLGKGGFGRVFEAIRISDNLSVAIKVGEKAEASNMRIKTMRREAEIMRQLHHPNVIKFYDMLESKNRIYLIMELAKGGDIRHLIELKKKAREYLPEEDVQKIAKQTFNALEYIHK